MRGMWSCGHAHMWPCGADHVRSYPREVMTTCGLVGVSRVRTSPLWLERRAGREKTDDRPDGGRADQHRAPAASAIAAAMRRLSHDGVVAPKPGRRHRAGRNVQLSLKISAGKEQFTAVAAAHGLAFGELLERALAAFVQEAKRWNAVEPPGPRMRSARRGARTVNSPIA